MPSAAAHRGAEDHAHFDALGWCSGTLTTVTLFLILPAFVYTQLSLDFIRRSVNIAVAIWMYFVFKYCQYMTSGY